MQNSYQITEDDMLLLFVEKSLKKEIPDYYQYVLSDKISDDLADEIEKIVGFSVKGYKNKITPGRIRHIYNRHGQKGIADNSLANIHDIARMGYVIENYNKIVKGNDLSGEFKNKDGTPSKIIVIQLDIGDRFYYVVEAVPDSAKKTLFVTTAYINKKDTIAEAGDAISPNPDVQDGLQSNVSSNIIIQEEK